MKNAVIFFIIFSFFYLSSCEKEINYSAEKSLVADSMMVVSPHPLASDVGLEILRQGGNAVDATAAVHFSLAVVYPRAGNIGGGGFMVYRSADGQIASLDYREKAPSAATRDMYLDKSGQVIDGLSISGHLAAGVPGTVDGLLSAWERYGHLKDRALIIDPAIRLASEGFRVSQAEADRLNRYQEEFREYNPESNALIKANWKEGDLLQQPELAATLTRIRDQGRDGFYSGKTAQLIVKEMQSGNGLISLQDLADYKAQWRQPITTDYRGLKVISMPPPSSGGVALAQLLELTEPFPVSEYGFQDARGVHVMVESMRRVYADRAEFMGDSDFYPVPLDSMMDADYLTNRMADFSPDTVTNSTLIAAGDFKLKKESFETTHTSIVDAAGNAVAVTTTLNSNYGCKVFVDGAGFLLNNEMDDFSAKPGVPNQFGLYGAEANAIEPGKRMLSSMTPTIIEKDGEVFMVLGSPGGSTIITAVFQVMINVLEYGMPIDEAVAAPRFHHQWLPDQILAEPEAISPDQRAILDDMGHSFNEIGRMAVVKAIHRLPNGQLHGAADPRNPDDDVSGQ